MYTLPPWTYGFLSDVQNCPNKALHKHVLKDLPREEKSAAQGWGIDVHKAFEKRLKEREPLPADMQRWEKFALVFDAAPASTKLVEESLAITEQLQKTTFFGDAVWGRGRLDAAVLQGTIAVLFDWKTGKPNEDPLELETQAFMLKVWYPGLTRIVGHFVWLKENRLGPQHDLSDFGRVYNSVRLTLRTIESLPLDGTDWPKKQNPLCGWCPVKSCEFNPKR